MKTALIFISNASSPIDHQAYLSACIDKVISDGCVPLTPGSYETYRQLTTMEYIERVEPVINVVYLFVDFGLDKLMDKVLLKYQTEGSKVEVKVERFTQEQLRVFIIQNIEHVLNDVGSKSKIPVEVLKKKTRKREIVEARQLYFKRAKEITKSSLASIGALVGKDHATVLHGIKTVNDVRELTERYIEYFGEPKPGKKPDEATNLPPKTEEQEIKINTAKISKAPEPIKNNERRPAMIAALAAFGFSDRITIRPYSGYRPHSF